MGDSVKPARSGLGGFSAAFDPEMRQFPSQAPGESP